MSRGFQGHPTENPNNCTDPYTPSFWLGKPGALTQLRMPDAGIQRGSSDQFAVHTLLDGQSVDRSPYLCRSWVFQHQWLTPDVMTVFMEYATRQRGFGPFILIDPQMKNLFTPNQASGTDALHTSEGFVTLSASESLGSVTGWSAQGERSLQWSWLPVTGAVGTLRMPAQTGLYGFCLPPGATFAFSGQIRSGAPVDAATGTLVVTPRLVLMNATGAIQSTVSGSTVSAVTGSATSFCVTGTVPVGVGGVFIEPQFTVPAAQITGIMNANPFFNGSVTNWTGVNGAGISPDSGASPPEGSGSMLIIPDGVTSGPRAQSEEVAVVPGSTYRYHAFLRVSVGGSLSRDVGIAWYDASHAQLSTSTQTQTPTPTQWVEYVGTAQAPIGAVFARVITTGPGVLAGANNWRVDAIFIQSMKTTQVMFDQLQFELTSTGQCSSWEYGQGQPLVGVRADTETIPRILRTSMNYIAVEVT